MTRNSELVKNSFLISLAQISAQIVNFLLLPLYIAVLSTEEYGRMDLYVTLRTVMMCVLFLGTEHSLFCFCVSEKDIKQKREYFTAGIVLSVCCYILFSLMFVAGNYIYKFQYAKLLYTYIFVYGIFNLLLYIARGFEKTGVFSIATAMGTILTVALNIVFVLWLKRGVEGILLSSTLAYTILSLYMIIHLPVLSAITYVRGKGKLKEMLAYSLPLVLNNVTGWVATSSDRLIIAAFLGNSMNGIYSLANKFYTILNIITNGFILAWAETAIKVARQSDHEAYYRKIIVVFMDGLFLIISGMIAVLPVYFKYFINETYWEAYYHIPIIIYAAFWYITSGITGYILLAHKKSREVGIGTFLVAIINLIVHFALIGKIGLYAASISTLVSYIGLFVFRYIFMYRYEKIPFPWTKVFLQFGVYLVLCVCYYKKGSLCLFAGGCIYLLFAAMHVKKYWAELMDLWKIAMKKVRRREK